MLGKTNNDEPKIVEPIKEILNVEVEPDGLMFDSNSILPERITEDADYQGTSIRFRGTLASARINMQIDIGFGDIVHPTTEESELPTMLDLANLCGFFSAVPARFSELIKSSLIDSTYS